MAWRLDACTVCTNRKHLRKHLRPDSESAPLWPVRKEMRREKSSLKEKGQEQHLYSPASLNPQEVVWL